MRINFKTLVLASLTSIILNSPVRAIEFADNKPIELHGDISIGNFFHNAQISTVNNGYDGIFDYRLEAHAELAKLGGHRISTVARTEGFTFYDGSSSFFR